jgi:hypothetical protein
MPMQHMKAYQIHDIVKPQMRMGLMPLHIIPLQQMALQ